MHPARVEQIHRNGSTRSVSSLPGWDFLGKDFLQPFATEVGH